MTKLKLKHLNITQHTSRDSGTILWTRIHNERVREWMNEWVTRNDALGEKRCLVEVPCDLLLDCNNCTPWRPVAPSRVVTLSCKLERFTPAPGLMHNPSPNPSSMAGDMTPRDWFERCLRSSSPTPHSQKCGYGHWNARLWRDVICGWWVQLNLSVSSTRELQAAR